MAARDQREQNDGQGYGQERPQRPLQQQRRIARLERLGERDLQRADRARRFLVERGPRRVVEVESSQDQHAARRDDDDVATRD